MIDLLKKVILNLYKVLVGKKEKIIFNIKINKNSLKFR